MSIRNITIIPVLIIVSVCANPSYAQADLSGIGPFNPHYIREVIDNNTIRANSRDSLNSIPTEVLYQTIFRKLQREIHLHEDLLTIRDKNIILNLPSHRNAIFSTQLRIEQTDLCQTLDLKSASNSSLNYITDLSERYEDIRAKTEQIFNAHYLKVINSLSGSARTLIQSQIEAIRGTEKLSYASVDMRSLSAQSPEIAKLILGSGCDHLLVSKESVAATDLLMKDEVFIDLNSDFGVSEAP